MDKNLRKLRKELGLTQEEFGKRIGIKRNTVASYEIGRNDPIDAVIFSICREFNVNERWLRTGSGDMFNTMDDEDEVAALVSEVLFEPEDPVYDMILSIIRTYSQLGDKSKEVFKQFAIKLKEDINREK